MTYICAQFIPMVTSIDLLAEEEDLIAPGFEQAAIDLAERSYTIIPDFLSPAEVLQVLDALQERIDNGEFKKAGIGTGNDLQIDRSIRGDHIKWIERNDARPNTRVFLDRVDLLMQTMNRVCFLGLKDYETHFAYYPEGTFYKRHLDQFKSDDHRRISFVLYLNTEWQPGDGGELRLYLPNAEGGEDIVDVQPTAGRLALFRSDIIEHEVLRANKERYSITGWMLDQLNELTFL